MATVHLLSIAPCDDDGLARLLSSASRDPFARHTLTDSPEEADLILFVESWEADWMLRAVREHPLTRKYREKTFVVCEQDLVAHMMPGIYANVSPTSAWTGRVRQGCYLWMYDNPFVAHTPSYPEIPYLYSFVGSLDTAPVRQKLATLHHPRGLVRDTSTQSDYIWWEAPPEEKAAFRQEYADVLQQSKFVLCPRGISPSTVRLFETMKTGRVPVILSDAWVPPEGPDWESFSIRVPECDLEQVPAVLETHEPDAARMGQRARDAWEAWFSPDVHFHRIVEWCLDIQSTRPLPERIGRFLGYAHLTTTPVLFRKWVKETFTHVSKRRAQPA